MILRQATRSDVQWVAFRMRETDRDELGAVNAAPDFATLVLALCEAHGGKVHATAVIADDLVPVAIIITRLDRPRVMSVGMFATDRWPRVAFATSRWALGTLRPVLFSSGVHRLEAASIEGNTAAHRWLEFLGFRREAVMPKFGRNGETFYLYGMTDDVLSPCHAA